MDAITAAETTAVTDTLLARPQSSDSAISDTSSSDTSTDTSTQSVLSSNDSLGESISDQVRRDMVCWIIETKSFGHRSFRIWLHPTDTIAEVKQLIATEHIRLAANRQILSYQRQVIGPDDSMVGDHENIPSGARIMLAFSLQSGLLHQHPAMIASASAAAASHSETQTRSLQFIYYSTVLVDKFYVITVRLRGVAPGGAEDEAPEFAGVLTDPISARVVATQCTAFLGQPIVPGQIVDITWSQIIIEDDDSDSETGSSLSDQELSGIIEATNGMAANDDDDECRRSDNIRDDGCDGNRKPQSLVDSGRLATPSQRALTGCQGTIINYCDSDYNNYAGDDDQNGKLPAPREKYKTSCDPLLVSSLQLSNIQSPVTNQLATVLSTTTTDKVIIKPAEPVEDSLRCYQCKRKISLAHSLFKCRCHHSFCNMHRYSDRHACTAEMNAKSLSNKNNININNNNNNNNNNSKKLPPIIQLAKL